MKIFKNHFALVLISMSIIVFSACNSNSNKSNNTQSKSSNGSSSIQEETREETREEAQIAGTYSGTDNVGMRSTIILRSGGSLIIQASVGDGTPDYGNWTGTADNLSLYHKDAFGNDELIGNAKVTDEGLRIVGGKFYSRQ
jgi:ABC-type Fe3+-hydroxamate transport system substrate-binding protein